MSGGESKAELILDENLKKTNLARKAVPKDGACMFRCVAEQVYGSQVLHPVLRSQCVRYMRANSNTFLPFVVGCSDLPWDHYLFELQKVETWGGYLELLALSKMLKVNFVIHTENAKPTFVDHGFPTSIDLAFSGGNHYDIILSNKSTDLHHFCQGIIYSIVQKIIQPEQEQENVVLPEIIPKNIAYECWLVELKKQESRDQLITKKLLEAPQNYSKLSGYYKKDEVPPQQVPPIKDAKKKNRGKRSKNNNNNNNNNNNTNKQQPNTGKTPSKPAWGAIPVSPLPPAPQLTDEELALQDILSQIEEVEKKELHHISLNKDFPTLKPTKGGPTPTANNPNITPTPTSPNITNTTSNANPSPSPSPSPSFTSTPTPPEATSSSPAAPKPNAWKAPKSWSNLETKPTQ